MQTVGKTVRELRVKKKLTQGELATAVSSKQSRISQIEKDTVEVGMTMAKRLSTVFGVSLDELMFPQGKENDPVVQETFKNMA